MDGGSFDSAAYGVSKNGSVIVGVGTSAAGVEAVRWVNGGAPISLSDFAGGGTQSSANGVSGDGGIIVGEGTDTVGSKAFIWDNKHGF